MQVERSFSNATFVPLTAEQYGEFQEIRETIGTLIQLGEQREELDRRIAYGRALQASGQEKLKKAQALEASGKEKLKKAQALEASGQQKIASGQQKIASGQQKTQSAEVKKRELLTKLFYTICNGKKELPADEEESVYAYIADGTSLIADKVRRFVLNSTLPVIQYATDHRSEICNFQLLGTEVHDVQRFADFVADENCSVKLVIINKNVSAAAKASLEWAKSQRKGKLTIQYT